MDSVITNVIVKRGSRYYVYSHDRKKKLGGPYATKTEAEKRLRQVEYFKMKTNTFCHITRNAKPLVRRDEMEGREWLVVPCVMLVEGVHAGSGGPIYYPAKELAKTPTVWNHKPVVVYHPSNANTACDPVILSSRKIGVIMNTTWKGGKLKAEAWLDPDRIEKVDPRVMEAIENETMMELSTGLYLDIDQEEGTWNGEDYVGIAKNYRPDHLAILPDIKGACSCDDGAGFLRLNSEQGCHVVSTSFMEQFGSVLDVVGMATNELSHGQIRSLLISALNPKGADGLMHFVEEVFDDTFIFERDGSLYRQGYKHKKNKVILIGIPEQVERFMEYKPVSVTGNERKDTMDKEKFINDLIENKATAWDEKDREFLGGLFDEADESTINKLVPVTVEREPEDLQKKTQVQNAAAKGAKGDVPDDKVEKEDEESTTNEPMTASDYIEKAPPEIRSMLRDGMTTFNQKRESLINMIIKNERNSFTEEYLRTKDIEELQNLAALAAPTVKESVVNRFNYAGQADIPDQKVVNQEPLVAPTLDFSK